MTLNSHSRLVQWTYYFADSRYRGEDPEGLSIYGKWPQHTTLCRFFWRAFVFVPLIWATIIGVGSFAIGGLCILLWRNLLLSAQFAGVISFVMVSCAAVYYWLLPTNWSEVTYVSIKTSTFMQGVKAIKSKFCPIIHIN